MPISTKDKKLKFGRNEFGKRSVTISRLQKVFRKGHMTKLRKSLANFTHQRIFRM